MASWTGQQAAKAEGRRRRQNAWIALAVAVFTYLAYYGGRNLLW